jgi:GGDEF domain-containing protein
MLLPIGGDEFGVIGVNCDTAGGDALRDRVNQSLHQAGVNASVELAMASAAVTISSAMTFADKQTYEEKRLKKVVESELVLKAERS